mmetsp:Transcript_26894/g.69158  ORF Transcript_26894/g.69158 Transcript_26894/m.69158 type:complete len:242 (+) Transcript_26894:1893-2618(+)
MPIITVPMKMRSTGGDTPVLERRVKFSQSRATPTAKTKLKRVCVRRGPILSSAMPASTNAGGRREDATVNMRSRWLPSSRQYPSMLEEEEEEGPPLSKRRPTGKDGAEKEVSPPSSSAVTLEEEVVFVQNPLYTRSRSSMRRSELKPYTAPDVKRISADATATSTMPRTDAAFFAVLDFFPAIFSPYLCPVPSLPPLSIHLRISYVCGRNCVRQRVNMQRISKRYESVLNKAQKSSQSKQS